MDEEIIYDVEETEENADFQLATIGAITSEGIRLIFEGEEEASEKEYHCNAGVKFAIGDRVKITKDSGTFIIDFPVGTPMEKYPIPAGGSDGQALLKDGPTPYAVKWGSFHGVPAGGAADAVLAKNSANDYDTKWVELHGIPSGGTTGQVLAKSAATSYAVYWMNPPSIPTGGTAGQVLTKKTATNYDTQWSTIGELPSGGTTGQYLKKSSNVNYAVEWASAPSSDRLTSGSKHVIYNGSALYPDSTASLGASNYYWSGCYFSGAMRFGNNAYNSSIGFFGTTPQSQQRVGSSGTLATLISALQKYGLIS